MTIPYLDRGGFIIYIFKLQYTMINLCHFKNKRLFKLFILCMLFLSCNKKSIEKETNKTLETAQTVSDSISISVNTAAKSFPILNVWNRYMNSDGLFFQNKKNQKVLLRKKIARYFKRQVVDYNYFDRTKGLGFKSQYIFINENTDSLQLIFEKERFVLDSVNLFLGQLHDAYKSLWSKNRKGGRQIPLEQLEGLYYSFSKEKSMHQNELLKTINNYLFYNYLLIVKPDDSRIDEFFGKIENPVASDPLRGFLFGYAKNRIDVLDFDQIKEESHSKAYMDMLSFSMYTFLSHEDNKGNTKYQAAADWLRTTSFYKKDSVFIEKKIAPLDSELFAQKVQDLELLDTKGRAVSMAEVMKNHPNDFFLIDFWATWCKPCIEGVAMMDKMKMPSNVSIISLSLDKAKDRAKWEKKTKELRQSISYLAVEDSKVNKSFLKFIELQSVPRYILMDKKMRLVDEAFFHPNEPSFLPKLRGVEMWESW